MMKSLCYQALGILLFLALSQDTYAQDLRLSADVDNTTPDAGEVFNYIINASCSNSTSDCESVVITDPLHPVLELISVSNPPDGVSAIVYDDITHELTITFDATNCVSCTPDGINTDEDDFAQGSTIQITVQVRASNEAFQGTEILNTVYATSTNAGDISSDAPLVTIQNGQIALTGCDQIHEYHYALPSTVVGGNLLMSIVPANAGASTIDNWSTVIEVPSNIELVEIRTPAIQSRDHAGAVYYERSDMPGVWHFWRDFNYSQGRTIGVQFIGLPAGVLITAVRMDIDPLLGDGSWNFNALDDAWRASLRLYTVIDDTNSVGDIIPTCNTITATVDGADCSITTCADTEVTVGNAFLTGTITAENINGGLAFSLNPDDQYQLELTFASPALNNEPVVGGVIATILPPGVTYLSHGPSWNYSKIQNLEPELELETLGDGRQLVRFVWHESYGNEFTIAPDGTWTGFGVDLQVQIAANAAPGVYVNEMYFSGAESDHICDAMSSGVDTENFLNGYSSDGMFCYYETPIEILAAANSGGLESFIEVRGSEDVAYNRFPDIGQTNLLGENDYRICLTNPNLDPIGDIVAINVLPSIGDTEVLNNSVPRGSEWQPYLTSVIQPPTGVTVEYSMDSNICLDELAGNSPLPFPSGCNNPNWSSICLLYTSPSPRDGLLSRMPSSA